MKIAISYGAPDFLDKCIYNEYIYYMYHRSPIWLIPKDQLVNIVNASRTFGEILNYFNMDNRGGNPKTLKKRLIYDHIDFSHIKHGVSKRGGWNKSISLKHLRGLSLENAQQQVLVKNSTFAYSTARRYILKYNLLPYICSICKCQPIWNNQSLILELDHIDGDNKNHELINLRFLCPNCHSQTNTFKGKKHKGKWIINYCSCGKRIHRQSKFCMQCYDSKIYNRPSKEELTKLVSTLSIVQIAKQFGVKSPNTIRRWCVDYGIDYQILSPFSALKDR